MPTIRLVPWNLASRALTADIIPWWSPQGRYPTNSGLLYSYYRSQIMFAVRLPPAIEKRLARLSKLTGRTKSYYVREALLEHLDDLEDVYLAERRLEDLRAGRSSTVPLADVMKRHGIEG
jgi:RHH-type rel operon transcriptional repressor/antitoxin RelB